MTKDVMFKTDDFSIRTITKEDKESYFQNCVSNTDKIVDYYTGTTGTYTKEQVYSYVDKIVDENNRFDFMIIKDNDIIGEVVFNEIDYVKSTAHYRIALFKEKHFGKGYGYKATKLCLDYICNTIGINEVILEVFPFNERGIKMYEKLGFKFIKEEIDADASNDIYKIINVMSYHK